MAAVEKTFTRNDVLKKGGLVDIRKISRLVLRQSGCHANTGTKPHNFGNRFGTIKRFDRAN